MTLQVGDWAEVIEHKNILGSHHPDLEVGELVKILANVGNNLVKVKSNDGKRHFCIFSRLKPLKEDARMPKYEVTREQQEVIEGIKKTNVLTLENVIYWAHNSEYKDVRRPLNGLDARTIIAMWDGVADVKPQEITRAEAFLAIGQGKTVKVAGPTSYYVHIN